MRKRRSSSSKGGRARAHQAGDVTLRTGSASLERLDATLGRLEGRIGQNKVTALLTFGLLLASMLCARPGIYPTFLGYQYALLSLNPFDFGAANKVGFRILTPLLSYMLGMRGRLLLVTNVLLAWLLLALVYKYFRRAWRKPAHALLAAATMALSLVTLTTYYFGGYCDSTTYVLIFLMWWSRRRLVWFYLCFLLGMFNRESMLFALPWLWYVQWSEAESKPRWALGALVGAAVSAALYLPVRNWVGQHRAVEYTAGYYFGAMRSDPLHWLRMAFPFQIVGLLSVFKLLWVIPIAAFASSWRSGDRRAAVSMAVLLASTAAQFVIAYDSSRLLTQAFMIMVLALIELHHKNPRWLARWGPRLLLLNVLIPQPFTAAQEVIFFKSVPEKLARMSGAGEAWSAR